MKHRENAQPLHESGMYEAHWAFGDEGETGLACDG